MLRAQRVRFSHITISGGERGIRCFSVNCQCERHRSEVSGNSGSGLFAAGGTIQVNDSETVGNAAGVIVSRSPATHTSKYRSSAVCRMSVVLRIW